MHATLKSPSETEIPKDIERQYGPRAARVLREAIGDLLPSEGKVIFNRSQEKLTITCNSINSDLSQNLGIEKSRSFNFIREGHEWTLVLVPGRSPNELQGQYVRGAPITSHNESRTYNSPLETDYEDLRLPNRVKSKQEPKSPKARDLDDPRWR